MIKDSWFSMALLFMAFLGYISCVLLGLRNKPVGAGVLFIFASCLLVLSRYVWVVENAEEKAKEKEEISKQVRRDEE